jgi:hypothetical protein
MGKPNTQRRRVLITDDEMLRLAKGLAPTEKHFARWLTVFAARHVLLKRKPKGSWQDAYKLASKSLGNTFAKGTPRTMRSSYAVVQRKRREAVEDW